MSQIKIYSTERIDQWFRATAMKRFGYGRGAISKAAVNIPYIVGNASIIANPENIYNAFFLPIRSLI